MVHDAGNRSRIKPTWLIGLGLLAVATLTGCNAEPQALVAPPVAEVVETPESEPEEIPVETPEPAPAPEDPFEAMLWHLHLTSAQLFDLPRPVIDTILPAGLGTAGPADLLPLAAVPKFDLTPAFNQPGDADPVLALEIYSDLVIEPIEARWTVVGQQPGWVRVIVPVGRGALPSVDPESVNHQAVWVPEDAVTLEPETNRVEVSVSNRRLTLFNGDDEVASFPVGVGVVGVTDTPLGLCSVIARVVIQTGAESLLTSCQSERLDGFAGADWATVAVHEGSGFSLSQGGAVSNGCVRVPPVKFETYLEDLNIGTPVLFVP